MAMDKSWLKQIGVAGSEEELAELESAVESALQLRVGAAICELLTDEQIEEFEAMYAETDEAESLAWLEDVCPDYRQIVAQETGRLRHSIQTRIDKASFIRRLAA